MTYQITPLHDGKVVELSSGSNLFEKQVLPLGSFNYKGNKFEITPQWVDDAIKAFNDKAVDQTYFALADEKNSHNVDERPDRFGGEVLKFVKRDNGLNAIMKLTDKSAQMIRDNPKLGVSVRFRNEYTREADGKKWPVVVDQVLGTLDPKITGMEPWKQITLSNTNDKETVEDASREEWEMTKPIKTEKTSDGDDSVTLKKSEYEKIMTLIANADKDQEDFNNLVNNLNKEEGKDGNKDEEKVGLSNEYNQKILELSRKVAASEFEAKAIEWKSQGVPPAIIELARPVLSNYEPVKVVTLSNGKEETIDARLTIGKILDECKGTVDLSNEIGNAHNTVDEELKEAYNAFLKQTNQF